MASRGVSKAQKEFVPTKGGVRCAWCGAKALFAFRGRFACFQHFNEEVERERA